MSAERRGWESTDPRDEDLLARLMLDSILPSPLSEGQAIAMGVAYAQLTLAESNHRLAEALEEHSHALLGSIKEDEEKK